MRTVTTVAAMAACVLAVAPAWAEGEAKDKWESSVAVGANVTRGNSETMLLNGSAVTERKGGVNEFRFSLEGNYGETEVVQSDGTEETQTNVQNAKGAATYRRLFNDRLYGALNAELSHDDIADIDYRLITGPAVGYYFIKSDRNTLSGETGINYIKDKVAGVEDDRFALRFAERSEHKLGASSKVWQSVEYLPTVDDFGNYLLNAEIGAEAAMTTKLSLRVVAQDKYNSEPSPGKDENDLTVIAGVSYKL